MRQPNNASGGDVTRPSRFLTDEHEQCDAQFAEAENAVASGDWVQAEACFHAFARDTLAHFAKEEEVFFRAFENNTGANGGPTSIMRAEHAHMRDTMAAMDKAVRAKDAQSYLGLSETLLMLMRQHNMKEENILYPMMDQVLPGTAEALLASLGSNPHPGGG